MGNSLKTRKERVAEIRETTFYPERDKCFERYLNGEDFDYQKLLKMGYDQRSALNLATFLNGNCEGALTWK